jgi:hypothetical protein
MIDLENAKLRIWIATRECIETGAEYQILSHSGCNC